MIHPSYVDLMKVVNKDVEEGETPVINSRYSIVMATAKRAHQIVDGDEPFVKVSRGEKPLSIAVDELNQGEIRILAEDEVEEDYVDPDEVQEENALDAPEGEEDVTPSAELAAEAEAAADEEPAAEEASEAGETPAEEEDADSAAGTDGEAE